LSLLAVVVFILLGFWQLSRLDQRRAYNAQLSDRLNAPPLVLTGNEAEDAASLQYRTAIARGAYDYAHEQAKVNQFWEGKLGVHLLTPLVISGSKEAIIVDRGWIPAADSAPDHWVKYAAKEPVAVTGWVQSSEANGTTAKFPSQPRTWFRIDTTQMQADTGYPLLPFWLQPKPLTRQSAPPYQTGFEPDLSEGPHMGYAIEWFGLALITVIGYGAMVGSGRLKDLRARGDSFAG
jgi:surfeit locus 1 family protein